MCHSAIQFLVLFFLDTMDTISGFSTKVLHENYTRKKIPENALNVTHMTHFSCPTPEIALPFIPA